MAFNGLGQPSFSFADAMASLAPSISFVERCVLLVKGMPIFAAGFGTLPSSVSIATQFKTFFVVLAHWIKNIFNFPTQFYSLANCLVRDAKFLRPLHCSFFSSVKGQKFIGAPIILLLLASRPFTVLWAIVSIVVNSIYGEVRFWLSHIRKKISKIQPSIANLYTSAAIILVKTVIRVKASLFNIMPSTINFSFGFSVFCVTFIRLFKMLKSFFINHNNSPIVSNDYGIEWERSQV